jgi:hypothetical protein
VVVFGEMVYGLGERAGIVRFARAVTVVVRSVKEL